MNELGREFLKSWDEFKNVVLAKVTPTSECDNPALIVIRNNGCLFNLNEGQIDKLALLGTIHQLILNQPKDDESISVALTGETVAILKQITALIK